MVAETDALKAATKTVLRDIAKHANLLAVGLQNAAPPQGAQPSQSILYLTEVAIQLEELSRTVDSSRED